MSDKVEELYSQLTEISSMLKGDGEISLASSLDDVHRKALLLAAASYFEHILSRDVEAFCDEVLGSGSPISSIVRIKAISRQYHTWFDWDKANANKFFSLFGPAFKKWIDEEINRDEELSQSITSFMGIGSDRNRLVHQNFGSFPLESSAEDLIVKYRGAKIFVDGFKGKLHTFLSGQGILGL